MNNKPVKLSEDQIVAILDMMKFIPSNYIKGVWYSATMHNKPVEIRYTARYNLEIRKDTEVKMKDTKGNVLDVFIRKEYFLVNVTNNTITYHGW